jgi:tetratricopeptide (TPR) repeat protein
VAWHRVVAEVLGEGAVSAVDAGRLGQHLLRAERPEQALGPLLLGATDAVQRDQPEAATLLRDLAQAVERGRAAGSPGADEAWVDLMLLEVEASLSAGRPHRARDQVEELRAWLEGQPGGGERTPEGARRRRARRLIASWAASGQPLERVEPHLLQVQEEALVALDWTELCLARLGLARCERRQGEASRALLTLSGARQAALAARAPRLLAEVVLARVLPLRDLARYDEALLAAEEALSRFRGLGQPGGMARSRLASAQVCRVAGRFSEAAALLQEAKRTFEELRDLTSLLVSSCETGILARLWGDLERAERELRGALLLAERLGAGDRPRLRLQLALTLVDRGELEAARPMLNALSVSPRPLLASVASAALAEVRRRSGDLPGARGELRSLSRIPAGARQGPEVGVWLTGCRQEPTLRDEFPELLLERR